jgi:hypothetical protein
VPDERVFPNGFVKKGSNNDKRLKSFDYKDWFSWEWIKGTFINTSESLSQLIWTRILQRLSEEVRYRSECVDQTSWQILHKYVELLEQIQIPPINAQECTSLPFKQHRGRRLAARISRSGLCFLQTAGLQNDISHITIALVHAQPENPVTASASVKRSAPSGHTFEWHSYPKPSCIMVPHFKFHYPTLKMGKKESQCWMHANRMRSLEWLLSSRSLEPATVDFCNSQVFLGFY